MSALTIRRQKAARRWLRAAEAVMISGPPVQSAREAIRDHHLERARRARKSGGSGS